MTATPHSDVLSKDQVDELCAFACKLADAAAEITLSYFRQPIGVDDKDKGDGFDPVTKADQGAEKAIRALIEEHYPDHGIFGEEFGIKEAAGPFEWVLDPVDGTRAFISGLPTWGTLIALRHNGEPVIGVIDQPYIKERYLGWPGGATLNDMPIKTRACPSLDKATLSSTDPGLFKGVERDRFDTLLREIRLVRYGLDCYAYAVMAAGHMDMVVESGLKPYDMMALIPVIRGAGGSATNWEGEAPGDCGRLLALGDPTLLEQVMDILQS
ncbi:histidinol-phosphatase [Kordiimonas lipolytica]|uniref:Histidinol-phosphatase n=1 Tax=Kordiimonas lipolytica TaxID=1662421 RepID=A0ABV8UF08_9PROT|nr:histidinol-phosphatase [Kordiimonas lipolytica]